MDLQSPAARPAAVAFVLVTVALDVLALGLAIPVLPKLVETMAGGDAVDGAYVFGLFGTAWALMQFLFQPLLGALSDRFGRRPVILISNLGLGIDYIVMALAPSLAVLFAGRVVSGICAASFSTASAYIADVTPADKRAQAFGLIGVAFGIGFVLGPAIGGLLGSADPRLPFWLAAAFSLANAAYGFFVLPESLPPEHRSTFAWSKANPIGALRLLASRRELAGLSSAMFLYYLAHGAFPAVFVLHAAYRFGWGTDKVGLSLAAFGIFSAIVQGGLIRPAIARFGERMTFLIGIVAGTIGFLTMGLASTVAVFWAAMPVMALWGFIGPSANGLMSRQVGADSQGRLQGAGSSLMAVASLIAPGLFTFAFARGIAANGWQLPGAPYLIAALLLVLAGTVAWQATRPVA